MGAAVRRSNVDEPRVTKFICGYSENTRWIEEDGLMIVAYAELFIQVPGLGSLYDHKTSYYTEESTTTQIYIL